jgi:hypothetical protein
MILISHLRLLLKVKKGWSFSFRRRPRFVAVVQILCLSHAHSDTLAIILDTMELVICIAKGRNLASSS